MYYVVICHSSCNCRLFLPYAVNTWKVSPCIKEHEVSVVSLLPHIMYYVKRLVFSEHTHLRDILILIETFSYLQFVIVLNVDTFSYLQTYRNACAEETCPSSGTDTSQTKARKDLLVETCSLVLLTNVLTSVLAQYAHCYAHNVIINRLA